MKPTTTTPVHGCMREQRIDCGEYVMIHLYPVRSLSDKKTRQKKHRTTREVQKKLNEKNSRRKLSALIHTNFTPGDTVVSLTYDRNHLPKSIEAAHTEMYNFIRRIKRAWSGTTGEAVALFKYIEVMETGKKGRIHHHLIIAGGLDRAQIAKTWGRGSVSAEPLRFDENGVLGLAAYLTKQNERIRYKHWSASRNLLNPCVEVSDDRIRREDAHHINSNPLDYNYIQTLYPGYTVSPYSVETTANDEIQLAPFVSFMLYKTNNRYFRRDEYGRLHRPKEFTDIRKTNLKTNSAKQKTSPAKRKRPRGNAAVPVPPVQ